MQYGIYIWRFIILLWWHWLTTDAQELHENFTIDTPSTIFIYRTNDIKEWNESIEIYNITRLATERSKHLIPIILCPWLCT